MGRKRLRQRKDHNHDNHPPDGSNGERRCLYCHTMHTGDIRWPTRPMRRRLAGSRIALRPSRGLAHAQHIAVRWLVTDDSGGTSETGAQGGNPPASQLAFRAFCACLATFAPAINRPLLLTLMKEFAAREEASVVAICAALESDVSGLSDEEMLEFMTDAGLAEPGFNRLIRAAYQILRLQMYFSAGVKEVRAWTIYVGDTASQASSMAILRRASSALSDRLRRLPRWQERGGREGNEYAVQNGDVRHFHFNV